jgi:hypothetical protein
MGANFVACNFAQNPLAAGEFVAGMCADAVEKLEAGGNHRQLAQAIPFVLAALKAAGAYAELSLGAGATATANQPELAARVKAVMAP